MFSSLNNTLLASYTKDCIGDQTFDHTAILLNAASCVFDATHGLGDAANTSSVIALFMGGFDAQKVTATINFPSPTTAGTEALGVFLGALRIGTGTENYLLAWATAGIAKISTVIAGTFATLSSTAWSVAQAVDMTITFQRVGLLLAATFHAASGPSDVNLSAALPSDSPLLSGGIMGARSVSKAIWCKSLKGEQIQ